MRRRRLLGLSAALVVVIGAAWVMRIVLSPPRRLQVLSSRGGPGVFHSGLAEALFSPDSRYLLTRVLETNRSGVFQDL